MTADVPRAKPSSTIGYVFGGLSFIPLVGVIFGIVAIVIGAVKGQNKVAILGVGGIAFTAVLYGSLFYFGFIASFGPYATLKVMLAEQLIGTDAGQIALYKHQHGRLPRTLAEIPVDRRTMFMPSDPWMNPFAYKLNDGGTFELRSAGPDGKFNTADDIARTF